MSQLSDQARALGGRIPQVSLHPAVLAAAGAVVADGGPWSVAFSGGADSMALLLLLWTHWPERRSGLRVLHFNHRLRGAESDGDREFCREVCGGLGVAFVAGEWGEAPATGASEAAARVARQHFFQKEMDATGSRTLWTGHQKNDIAETQLMRLARGSSAAGMAAPRPVQKLADGRRVLRPLLTLEKAEIARALVGCGIAWREDASNLGGVFFRNRIRNEVLPVWAGAAENDALGGAALTRELLDEDDAALAAWLAGLISAEAYSESCFDARPLKGKPRALWRRALRRWRPLAGLAREGFERVLDLCDGGFSGRTSAGDGVIAVADGMLRFESAAGAERSWGPVTLATGAELLLPDGAGLRVRVIELSPELRERIFGGGVDARCEAFLTLIHGSFTVRSWRAGDRYQPLGAPGSAKLQDMFVNRKVPPALRGALPVVCDDAGAILWVPGFPPAADWKLRSDSVTAAHLTYHTGTCTVRT